MFLHSVIFSTGFLGFALLLGPPSIMGQVSAESASSTPSDSMEARTKTVPMTGDSQANADTLHRARSESEASPADSMQGTGVPQPPLNTLRPVQSDTPGGPDRPAAAPDSLRPNGNADTTKGPADTTKKADSSAAASAPRDSILIAACSAPSGSASVARDLLVVVFTPEAGKRERAAAAKSVAGKLLGPVSSEPGAYYLRVPADGQEYRLRVAADQLIQLAQVKQVGSRVCPPPSPTGKPGPSGLS
jgi:hypothetical protein